MSKVGYNSAITGYRNPENGYIEERSGLSWLWVLLFGPLYFAVKGIWGHAIGSFIIGVATMGISQFIYPFFTQRIIYKHYMRKGWEAITY